MLDKQLDKQAKKYEYGFKEYYNIAKFINLIIIVISIAISVISILNIIYNLQLSDLITFITFIWILISIYLSDIKDKNKKNAADLQEKFDTYIFDIPLNEKIMYPDKNSYRIFNWSKVIPDRYYDISTKDYTNNAAIINIQKDNITYDKKMREKYCYGNHFSMILYIIFIISLSMYMKLQVYDIVIKLIMPSINVFKYILENILNLNNELKQLYCIEFNINNLIDNLNKKNENELTFEIRKFQDSIYLKRKDWVMIPNYLYKIDKILKNISYKVEENPIQQKCDLKSDAIEIVKKLGIMEYLKKYGRVEIVGGVANDFIVNKDIDIHLLTNKNLFKISQKLQLYLQVFYGISNVKIEDMQSSKGAICLIIENYNEWQIEIWMSNRKSTVGFKLKYDLRKFLDDDKRRVIMELKQYYYKKGLLYGQMSTMIYNAVLFNNVTNLDEFKNYIKIKICN